MSTDVLTNIILAVISASIPAVSAAVVLLLRRVMADKKFQRMRQLFDVAVQATEEWGLNQTKVGEKAKDLALAKRTMAFSYVERALDRHGLKVDVEDIYKELEAAVLRNFHQPR